MPSRTKSRITRHERLQRCANETHVTLQAVAYLGPDVQLCVIVQQGGSGASQTPPPARTVCTNDSFNLIGARRTTPCTNMTQQGREPARDAVAVSLRLCAFVSIK